MVFFLLTRFPTPAPPVVSQSKIEPYKVKRALVIRVNQPDLMKALVKEKMDAALALRLSENNEYENMVLASNIQVHNH